MQQASIDWTRDANLPVAGNTPEARHASATGAMVAVQVRGKVAIAYVELLKLAGSEGLSDFEAAKALGRAISSMNSTRNGLGRLIEPSGSFEISSFGTRRARWRLRAKVGV